MWGEILKEWIVLKFEEICSIYLYLDWEECVVSFVWFLEDKEFYLNNFIIVWDKVKLEVIYLKL